MDENSTALDCLLILFYINTKHMLKTRQLSEKVFLEQMVKHCRENGFHNYSAKEIKSIWKKLVSKYTGLKIKSTNEDREKWKYYQILDSCFEQSDFHKEKPSKFSEATTSRLIECFTNEKITCIIHGYESDQVLSEIQTTCRSVGVYLSKDDIKEKWKSLTNIYKFLIDRGKTNNTWVHFDAMKSHYQDNFWNKANATNDVKVEDRPRRLRHRSKSVGWELKTNHVDIHDNSYPLIYKERKTPNKRKASKKSPTKRPRNDAVSSLNKRLRNNEGDDLEIKPNAAKNVVSQVACSEGNVNVTPTSKIRVINIDHSDICQKSGNFTINLPSITKQFSDNEFLPLKKRLRTDGDNSGSYSVTSNEIGDEYLELSASNVEDIQNQLALMSEANCVNESKLTGDYLEYQKMPNEEFEKKLSVFNYTNTSGAEKSPILLIIKVDDRGNPVNSKGMEIGATNSQPENGSCEHTNTDVNAKENVMPANLIDNVNQNAETASRSENSNPSSSTETVCPSIEIVHSEVSDHENNTFLTENEHCEPLNNNNGEVGMENSEDNSLSRFSANVNSPGDETNHKNVENEAKEDFVFRKPLAVDRKIVSNDTTNPQTEKQTSNSKCRLPVKVGGKLKEIYISLSDLNKIEKLKPKTNCSNLNNRNIPSTNPLIKNSPSGIKFLSQVVKPAAAENPTGMVDIKVEEVVPHTMESSEMTVQPLESDSNLVGNDCLSNSNQRLEEFDNESIVSEAVGDNEGLKDNLLATVIDFQEQNNQEFIEIKNLMKQNNLLQRETNRLLRLILEKS